MKVLQVIQKLQNRGAETFACQLSNHLVAMGHEVVIVALFEGKSNLPFKGKIISLKGSKERRFFDFPAWKRMAHIVRQFDPDVVQVNAGDTLKYVVFSKLLFGWKNTVFARNASEVGAYMKSFAQKRINKFLYSQIDGAISVSEASRSNLIEHFPFLEGKSEVIPVGLEHNSVKEDLQLKPLRVKHVIHVGGFSFEKNHKGLLRIFSSLLDEEPGVHLHLVGDGPLREEIERKVSEMKLTKNVSFYGFVEDPLNYIKAADVLVLPSIIEGLPGVLLEAMYCKTPVIAYNVGGISEIISPNTGTLVEKGAEKEFRDKMLQTLVQPNLKQINSAYQMVLQEYMNEKLALRFLEYYRKNLLV